MFSKHISRNLSILAVICVLGIGGYYGGKSLFVLHSDITSYPVSSINSAINTKDVPESVVKQITGVVAGVAGIDQMVVLPAATGNGYSVTAQIELGPGTSAVTGVPDKIQNETAKYFNQLFSKDNKVTDAEVYFLANGRIIASAGLGVKAYHELTARTGTNSYNLTVSLEMSPTVMGQGENNSWFEIGKTE